MKCPLTIDKGGETVTGSKPHANECLGEECAWWDPAFNCCCIRTASWIIGRMANMLKGGFLHGDS